MNPVQWLKAIYETFGTPFPRASLVAVMLLGGVGAGGVWLFAAKQVQKDLGAPTQGAAPAVSGSASTKGSDSPAVTGNGNDIQYDQPSHPKAKTKPAK
jgi:hypothetical protein